MTPIQEGKKKEVMKHQSRAEEEKKGRRKKTFQAKISKKTAAEENGISNRQKCPSFISPLAPERVRPCGSGSPGGWIAACHDEKRVARNPLKVWPNTAQFKRNDQTNMKSKSLLLTLLSMATLVVGCKPTQPPNG